MKRKPKTKTIASEKSEERLVLQYFNYAKMENCLIDENWIKSFCKGYVEWAINDKSAINYKFFYINVGICKTTIDRLKKHFPFLEETINHVKEIIGIRREQMALFNEINASVFMNIQPTYDMDLKELIQWRTSLKDKGIESDSTTITVIKQSFEELAAQSEWK